MNPGSVNALLAAVELAQEAINVVTQVATLFQKLQAENRTDLTADELAELAATRQAAVAKFKANVGG